MDLTSFRDWLLINVAKKTTDNYVNQMISFFKQYDVLSQENLNKYLSSKIDVWCAGSFNAFFKAIKKYMLFTKVSYELPLYKQVEFKPRPYLKESELFDILEKLPVLFSDWKKVQCILTLAFYTGLRPKEIYMLKRENIDLVNRKILIQNTKTHTSRIVFLTKEVVKLIKEVFEKEVETDNAFNLSSTSISYYFRQISKCMNVKIYPYMARHIFAHLFLKKSKNNLISLAKILGHNTIATTQLYCQVNENERQEEFDTIFKRKG